MDRNEIINELKENSNEKLSEFATKLYKSRSYVYGVKVPKLREISKTLNLDYFNNINDIVDLSVEEKMICGFIISNQKLEFNDFSKYVCRFNKNIDSWAVTDSVIASLKQIKKYKKDFLLYIEKFTESHDEFVCRFGVICLLDYYITEEYIDYILLNVEKINKNYYYVQMAVAWLISFCFIKFRDKTLIYLQNSKLDDFTFNKALQKTRESFRVSIEDKELLKEMKRIK